MSLLVIAQEAVWPRASHPAGVSVKVLMNQSDFTAGQKISIRVAVLSGSRLSAGRA
jgi:hypothetical protein